MHTCIDKYDHINPCAFPFFVLKCFSDIKGFKHNYIPREFVFFALSFFHRVVDVYCLTFDHSVLTLV